jgi:UDP-3-O-[3-hydroxymyristoyl] glucosamine N-acyltransferase
MVNDVCALSSPKASALAFCTKAGMLPSDLASDMIVLIPEAQETPVGRTHIVVPDPRLAFAIACGAFFERRPVPTISPGAVIDATATIGADVSIGPGCVIGPDVQIGDGTEIRANVVIGPRVVLGQRCLVKSGAIIGEEGFGIAKTPAGHNFRIPQFGSVIIGDEVEIGSLTTVTSGTLNPVLIADRVKIDDHVHIGHNAIIGEDTIITACAEMGRVQIGKRVWIGPNTSIKEGLTICDDAFVGIGSVIIRSLDTPGVYAGVPTRLLRANKESS